MFYAPDGTARRSLFVRGTDLAKHIMPCEAANRLSASRSRRRALGRATDRAPRRPSAWLPWRRDLSTSMNGAAPRGLRVMLTGNPPERVAGALQFLRQL